MIISKHAMEKALTLGISRTEDHFVNLSTEAFCRGIGYKEASDRLRRYISRIYKRKYTANNVRLYYGNTFVFCGEVLVTVWRGYPSWYDKTAIKRRYRRQTKRFCKDICRRAAA